MKLFSQDRGCFLFLQHLGANAEFAAFPEIEKEKYDWIILNLPRQKALLTMMLDCAATLLATDGVLWLAGEKKAGIKSAEKQLKCHFEQVRKLDNARHCSLYEAYTPSNKGTFTHLAYQDTWDLKCNGFGIKVVSYPGVFAHGRLDEGTALLLRVLSTMKLQGSVLDFACGAGQIGACIAARNQAACVTLLDTNALALQASMDTLEANQLNGSVLASDGLSEIKGSFDVVVSNPPIHAGIKTDNRLGMRLLESLKEHISPDGQLILVANIHLPYEKWLLKQFKTLNELVTNNNYKVIMAKNGLR